MTDRPSSKSLMKAAPVGSIMTRDECVTPQQARIFDLALKPTGSGIDIEYAAMGVIDFSAEDRQTVERELLAYLSDASRPRHPVKWKAPSNRPHREQVSLSLRAPSELKNASGATIKGPIDRVMYVICLHMKSSEEPDKFRFTVNFDPFSYSQPDLDNFGLDKAFYNPVFIYDDHIEPGPGKEIDPRETAIAPTTRAGFVFDYGNVKSATNEFVLRFNIHCELAARQRYLAGKVRDFVPIIIDPDVGHPGGNHGGPPTDP